MKFKNVRLKTMLAGGLVATALLGVAGTAGVSAAPGDAAQATCLAAFINSGDAQALRACLLASSLGAGANGQLRGGVSASGGASPGAAGGPVGSNNLLDGLLNLDDLMALIDGLTGPVALPGGTGLPGLPGVPGIGGLGGPLVNASASGGGPATGGTLLNAVTTAGSDGNKPLIDLSAIAGGESTGGPIASGDASAGGSGSGGPVDASASAFGDSVGGGGGGLGGIVGDVLDAVGGGGILGR